MSVRVTSWIVLLAAAETIHEITLNNTNDGPLALNQRFLPVSVLPTLKPVANHTLS